MIDIILLTLLLFFKKEILMFLFNIFNKSISEAKIIYFYIRSLNDKKASIFLYDFINDLLNIFIFSLLSNYILLSLVEYRYLGILFGFLIILFKLIKVIKNVEKSKSELLEELNKFIFIYEMEQITGSNLFNAISLASEEISYIEVQKNLDDYIKEFEALFKLTKWVVVKRIVVLIEQNKNFTSRELGLDF